MADIEDMAEAKFWRNNNLAFLRKFTQ
jgi:hypothetical protein